MIFTREHITAFLVSNCIATGLLALVSSHNLPLTVFIVFVAGLILHLAHPQK